MNVSPIPLLAILILSCSQQPQPVGEVRKGRDAFGDWTTDAPGVRRLITVADLPAPNETASSNNGPRLVPRPEGAWPRVPERFEVKLLVEGLTNPRKIVTAPNGDLFVAESRADRIKVLRLAPDGVLAEIKTFADGFRQPFGIAFYPPGPEPEFIYVANTDSVVRLPYRNVGSSRVDLQACKLEYSIVSPK